MRTRFDGHTPGLREPYHQKWDDGADRVEVDNADGCEVAAFPFDNHLDRDEAWANAKLFAAAPDLLRAGQELAEAARWFALAKDGRDLNAAEKERLGPLLTAIKAWGELVDPR